MRRVAAALFAGIACAQAPGARARDAEPPIELSAERLEYERGRDLFVATRSVVVRRGERQISADWVAFSPSTGRGVASGNVVLTDGRDTLHTRFVDFDVDGDNRLRVDHPAEKAGITANPELVDYDGNEYVDYLLGSGPMLLGHAHPAVVTAVRAELERGSNYLMVSEPEIGRAHV